MEIPFYFLCLALLLPLLCLKLIKHSSKNSGLKLPPGPRQLPIISSLHHLLVNQLPHRALRDLARHHGPIMFLKLGEVPAVVVSSPDGAREIMKTHDITFATRPTSPTTGLFQQDGIGIALSAYDEHWRQMRKICILELLSSKRVLSFRHTREEEMANLVKSISLSSSLLVNLSEKTAVVITDIAMRAIFGDMLGERDAFLQRMDEMAKILSGFNIEDLFPSSRLVRMLSTTRRKAEKNQRAMYGLMESIMQQHQEKRAKSRGDEHEDLLDVLLRIQKEGGLQFRLDTGTIKAVLLDIYGAGSETSSRTLVWAMSELMKNPLIMQNAQSEVCRVIGEKGKVSEDDLKDMKYMKLVIKETLRLHPALPLLLPRECRETTRILGCDVLKGTLVLVNAYAISTHPDYWHLPDKFNPERFENCTTDFKGTDYEFIPFGSGRRICPGMTFAQASMELVLATLLYHFDWELPNGVEPDELDMDEVLGITVGRKTDLWLNAVLRVPLASS